jgi:hypothetical protein
MQPIELVVFVVATFQTNPSLLQQFRPRIFPLSLGINLRERGFNKAPNQKIQGG